MSTSICNRLNSYNEYRNQDNILHREDGPAIEYHDGRQVWHRNGACHRDNAPAYFNPNAIESHQVRESWWQDGKCHRLDGPARTYGDGQIEFWIEGRPYTKLEFDAKIKTMSIFTEGREVFPDGSYCITAVAGNKIWYNESVCIHRVDGPAIEYADGSKEWYIEGKRHRLDGPAVEYADGTKYWYIEDKLHRVDGPAIEYADGYKEWYIEGKRHRVDGPAVESADGSKEWYIEGKHHTEHKFNIHPDVIKFQEYLKKVDKVVDMSKDKMKIDGEGFFNNVKKNAVTAAPRVLAKTISKGARQGLLQLMKAKKLKKHWIKSIEEMMETEYGLAAISMGLSLVFKYMPGLKDDPRAALICDEFQVGAMELAGNELVDEVMKVMLPAIMQYQNLDLGKTEKLRVAPTKEVMEEEEESVASIPPLQASLKCA